MGNDDRQIVSYDYKNLGFNYLKTDFSYLSYYTNGVWDEGRLTQNDRITITAASTLYFGQQAFEGLKAFRKQDGSIHIFRPTENAKRLIRTCRRLLMPEVPIEKFLQALQLTVKANHRFVPPYDTKASLYLRPYIIGISDSLALRPAKNYLFGIICSPVGPYFKGSMTPINLLVTEYPRSGLECSGNFKNASAFASTLFPNKDAKERGFADCLYLDPYTHTKIEETGNANFFAITHHNVFVTPSSPNIFPSITKSSLITIASKYLSMKTEERDIRITRITEFQEVGICGTSGSVIPVGGIQYKNRFYKFSSENEAGPVIKKLYETLIKIQFGDLKAPEGWLFEVEDCKKEL